MAPLCANKQYNAVRPRPQLKAEAAAKKKAEKEAAKASAAAAAPPASAAASARSKAKAGANDEEELDPTQYFANRSKCVPPGSRFDGLVLGCMHTHFFSVLLPLLFLPSAPLAPILHCD